MADSAIIQDIMDKLQDTTETLMTVAGEVANQAEALATHNTSTDAHPYIQQMIRDLDSVTTTELNTAISNHAKDSSAHADIRTLITNLNTSVVQDITDGVEEHNVSTSSHPDIRASLTTLDNEMNTVRQYKSYIEMLDDLFGTSGSIPALDSLTSRVTSLESSANSVNDDISGLDARVDTLEVSQGVQDTRLNNLETIVTRHTSEIVGLTVNMNDVRQRVSIIEGKLVGNIDMSTLVHTLPTIVKASTQYTVKFSGIVVAPGNSLSFSLTGIPAGLSFSKTTGIAQDENITLSVGAGVTPGAILSVVLNAELNTGDVDMMYISTKVASLPNMSTLVVTGIPALVVAGKAYPFTFTAATDPDGNAITYTPQAISSGTCTINSANRTGIFTPASNAAAGTAVSFVVRATTSVGYSDKTVNSVIAAAINIASLVANGLPAVVKPGAAHALTFTGATSANGTVTYGVAAKSGSVVTFSKSTNIASGESVTMNIPTGATRNSTQTLVVTATDSAGATTTKEFTTVVNSLPDVAGVVTAPVLAGQVVSTTTPTAFTISGATDVNSQALTYNIEGASSGLVFSKTSGITAGESVTITVPKVATTQSLSFGIRAVDALGEQSAAVKTITFTANPVYVVNPSSVTSPTEGQVMTSDAFTFTFAPIDVQILMQ